MYYSKLDTGLKDLFSRMKITRLVHEPKRFHKYKTSKGIKIHNTKSNNQPVNSFADISFIMVVYGENASLAAVDVFAAILQVTTRRNWQQGLMMERYLAL